MSQPDRFVFPCLWFSCCSHHKMWNQLLSSSIRVCALLGLWLIVLITASEMFYCSPQNKASNFRRVVFLCADDFFIITITSSPRSVNSVSFFLPCGSDIFIATTWCHRAARISVHRLYLSCWGFCIQSMQRSNCMDSFECLNINYLQSALAFPANCLLPNTWQCFFWDR